jgi:hypothetical protein
MYLRETWSEVASIRLESATSFFEHSGEHWGFHERGEFIEQLSNYQLLKEEPGTT